MMAQPKNTGWQVAEGTGLSLIQQCAGTTPAIVSINDLRCNPTYGQHVVLQNGASFLFKGFAFRTRREAAPIQAHFVLRGSQEKALIMATVIDELVSFESGKEGFEESPIKEVSSMSHFHPSDHVGEC